MALYTPGKQVQHENPDSSIALYMQRQPGLRAHWKPDILRLDSGSGGPLREYTAASMAQQPPDLLDDESMAVIGAVQDLAGQKDPPMRVLELDNNNNNNNKKHKKGCGCKAEDWLDILDKDTAFSRCRSWHLGKISEDGCLETEDDSEGPLKVIAIPRVSDELPIHAIDRTLIKGTDDVTCSTQRQNKSGSIAQVGSSRSYPAMALSLVARQTLRFTC